MPRGGLLDGAAFRSNRGDRTGARPLVGMGAAFGARHEGIQAAAPALVLAVIFVWDLLSASCGVARIVLAPRIRTASAIITMPVSSHTPWAVTLFAYFNSLTPGSTCLHVSADHRRLFVYVLDCTDADATAARFKRLYERWISEFEVWSGMQLFFSALGSRRGAGTGAVLARWRMVRGSRFADRFLTFDMLTAVAVGFAALTADGTRRGVFLDIGLGIVLINFVATAAFAGFLGGESHYVDRYVADGVGRGISAGCRDRHRPVARSAA